MDRIPFDLHSPFKPSGDQVSAIAELLSNVKKKKKDQILLGVTGSGKTFTMANIINETNRPTLIMAHNKTLAAQLYSEMKEFFPNNAVEYFISYYDYYQPEAYVAKTDTFIEKDSSINEQIEIFRHSATRSLLERKDVIVVASVSCIYGLGSPVLYAEMILNLSENQEITRKELIDRLIELQYDRNDSDYQCGNFSVRGDLIDIFPAHLKDTGWRISMFGDEIESIHEFNPITQKKLTKISHCVLYADSHFITPRNTIIRMIKEIKEELAERVEYFRDQGMLVEAQRVEQRTKFDIEMLLETTMCKGIENYSRYLSGSKAGSPPPTLFEYLPKDALLFVDESHVTVPQVRGMFNGDRARKLNLVNHGFRLPSALDNRPLQYDEWQEMRPQTIFVSATPGKLEMEMTDGKFTEQLIRPTGLVDPECDIRPVATQVDDLLEECKITTQKDLRVLCTTLTKKMAEDLSSYLCDIGVKAIYLHSDIKTMERVEIINSLRLGEYHVLVGVNLLREGLDIPECGLVAILDADKEGFLRSETSLVQTIGRAARNAEGRVILYADKITGSMRRALDETNRRRKIQLAYNKEHNITPTTIRKDVNNDLFVSNSQGGSSKKKLNAEALRMQINELELAMVKAAENLAFESSIKYKKEIAELQKLLVKAS